jgi:hypothetical protein
MTVRRALLVGLIVAWLLPAAAAHADRDLQLWLEASVSRKLGRFTAGVEQGLRFGDDVSRLEAFLPAASLAYRPHKAIRLGVGYRFEYERNRRGEMVMRHRLHAEARPRLDLGPVRLTYRLRFQEQLRYLDDVRHAVRNRLAAELKGRKPWTPAVSAETFHRLGGGEPVHLRKIRLVAGVGYQLGAQELMLFYAHERAQADPRDPVLHILGLGFEREL